MHINHNNIKINIFLKKNSLREILRTITLYTRQTEVISFKNLYFFILENLTLYFESHNFKNKFS